TKFETRRYITNGQLEAVPGSAWDDDVVVAQASYQAENSLTLYNVANIASIQVGSLVTGNGVGREVYVREVDESASSITLSQQLFDAEGTQEFTFTRFKYLLDFSGFTKLSDLIFDRVEFRCNGDCSAIMLAPLGIIFQLNDCQFIRPKDRGVTSIGDGCQGMIIDRCNFESDESGTTSQLRKSICYNTNANDVKVRNCRAAHFRHFGIMNGGQSIIANNHFFHGDDETQGVRLGGLILTSPNCTSTLNGNYIDNCFIEWTNEHDATPSLSGYSFGGLNLTGNIFMSIDSSPSHRWIVVKPFGPDHFIDGLSVQGNVFRTYSGTIERVEKIDTTYAEMDFSRMRNIIFEGNSFHGVDQPTRNPHNDVHSQSTAAETWVVDTENYLPFGGYARTVDALVPVFGPENAAGDVVFHNPYSYPSRGSNSDEFHVIWPEPVKGQVRYSVRMDNPA
ncbi:MAG: right-handed parallel beta-helix repeat-containing protein, partial [Octadecabacter sp.]